MNWRFSLNDTVIREPIGWDACQIKIKRDLEKHGIFFDYTSNDFRFHGTAMILLKDAYDSDGVEAEVILKIEQACDDQLEELYSGRALFSFYKFYCGSECYVIAPIETSSDILKFTNRFDQAVNLETDKAFDETTALAPYARLPFEIKLPSKAIFLQDYSKNESLRKFAKTFEVVEGASGGFGMIELPFEKRVAGEIGGFNTNENAAWTDCGIASTWVDFPNGFYDIHTNPLYLSPIVNLYEGSPNYFDIKNPCELSYRVKGKVKGLGDTRMNSIYVMCLRLPEAFIGEATSDYEVISQDVIYSDTALNPLLPDVETLFDISFSNPAFQLHRGDRIYFFIAAFAGANPTAAMFEWDFDEVTDFKLTDLSKTKPTLSNVFMVNEALSRITEAITDDKIRAYSEYFGRTDSQPYNHVADGCGSLEVITKGLFIRRQENRIPDKPFLMTVSMKEMWEGLEPIHHIGMGMEEDTNRPGFNRLRIEPWKYFYKDQLLLSCVDIAEVEKRVVDQEHYSTFKFGYEKWEAEEYNGLDEFLTKRGYRTALTMVKNELTKLSKMVASGYAWEVTRRKGDLDSKDWRYDNDNFIACVKRFNRSYSHEFAGQFLVTSFVTNEEPVGLLPGDAISITGSDSNDGDYIIDDIVDIGGGDWVIYFTSPVVLEADATITIDLIDPGFVIEQGNVLTPANIIDPDSIYNYRISPIRIALRWMDKVFAGYKQQGPGSKIIFTDGEANYYASGEMESNTCKWESDVLAENATIDYSVFADILKAQPFLSPERIEFEYKMSVKDFKAVKANPYGFIHWTSNCEQGDAWIDEITYVPENGTAKFTLIPKYS